MIKTDRPAGLTSTPTITKFGKCTISYVATNHRAPPHGESWFQSSVIIMEYGKPIIPGAESARLQPQTLARALFP